jgi:hypothetical protein
MGDRTLTEVTKLLHHEGADRRIAAAIVLGELKAKGPDVLKGLVGMLESGAPALQRPALGALARTGPSKCVPSVLPLLASKDGDVRSDAVEALVACGEEIVPKVRERLAQSHGDERKALDAVLARFGGSKDAVSTLLAGLESTEPEIARAVAADVRQRVKNADAKTRRLWLSELTKIIERMRKTPPSSPIPLATAVKILGTLEDPKATDLLLSFATDDKTPFAVRQEALIALRFSLSEEARAGEIIDAMVSAAESPDRLIAQAAIMGLAAVDLPQKHAARIARLAGHPDVERARIVIEKLGRQPGPEATKALVEIIAKQDRRRGEMAVAALKARAAGGAKDDAGPALAAALASEVDADRANSLRIALRPLVPKLPAAAKKKLVEAALGRVAEGSGWEAHVDVAREADDKALAAGLRELVTKLARAKKDDKVKIVLGLLARAGDATDDDRYKVASLRLRESPRDTLPAARKSDDALGLIETLADRGFNVVAAMKKDKALELDHLYYVGFHFAEERHPLGAELLATEGGRAKIAKMAKNKLALAGG